MCGIAAIVSFTGKGKEKFPRITQCAQLLRHRGPDHQAYLIDENFAMAHARLSIIDLSAESNQPFVSHDKRFVIVYNGELFNYKALGEELKQKGCSFYTDGDVEVLVNLYKVYGKEGLNKINGFFSFALYDRQQNRFFAARDRYGIKPFYFHKGEDYFACGSELRTLKHITQINALDKTALFAYLQLTYIPEKASILQSIEKLQPGECITIENNNFSRQKYYELKLHSAYKEIKDPQKEFYNLLESAVEARLVADVPVGSFLSGGIDSSVITAIASQKTKGLQTFSIGFKNNTYFDESAYAEIVAKKYNTQHHTFYLGEDEAAAELDTFFSSIDEPFADSSAFNVFVLCKKTKPHVKVALSGDGADELFAGYNKHRAEWMIRNQWAKTSVFKTASSFGKFFPSSRNSRIANKIRQLQRFAEGASLSPQERYWRWASFYKEENAEELLSLSASERTDFKLLKNHYINYISVDYNSILLADLNLVLTSDMLVKVDRMSMAHGLEVRNPFLDYRMVEFAFSLADKEKIDAALQKKIIKESCAHLLPAEILTRKKHGFETPVQQWLRTVLKDKLDKYCLDKEFIETQNIFNYTELEKAVERSLSDHAGETTSVVWSILIFNYWYAKNMMNA